MHAQSFRTRALRRTALRLHLQRLRYAQSRSRARSGWPSHKALRHRASGLRYGRSLPPPMQRGSRNSQGSSPTKFRVAGGDLATTRNAAAFGRTVKNPKRLRAKEHCKNEMLTSRIVLVPTKE